LLSGSSVFVLGGFFYVFLILKNYSWGPGGGGRGGGGGGVEKGGALREGECWEEGVRNRLGG
jgi:hypothetical protein